MTYRFLSPKKNHPGMDLLHRSKGEYWVTGLELVNGRVLTFFRLLYLKQTDPSFPLTSYWSVIPLRKKNYEKVKSVLIAFTRTLVLIEIFIYKKVSLPGSYFRINKSWKIHGPWQTPNRYFYYLQTYQWFECTVTPLSSNSTLRSVYL